MTQRMSIEEYKQHMKRPAKYGNARIVIDGINFHSRREAKRYQELVLMQKAGLIDFLQLQVRFPLIVGSVTVCTYIADFCYMRGTEYCVEDSKGYRTPEFKLKSKLFEAIKGFKIKLT